MALKYHIYGYLFAVVCPQNAKFVLKFTPPQRKNPRDYIPDPSSTYRPLRRGSYQDYP